MFKGKQGVTYEFYHLGIPTQDSKEGEFYSEKFDMHTTEIPGSRIHAQWHRFGENCPLHPLIQTIPHVAFKVNDLEKACEGEILIMPIHEPIPGYRCAMIDDAGLPVELVQTDLSYSELDDMVEAGLSTCKDVD